MGTLKPQSNGPLYSNTVIGTLAVNRWTVTFGTAQRGLVMVLSLQSLLSYGSITHMAVSKMTYNVSSGTLNSTIP